MLHESFIWQVPAWQSLTLLLVESGTASVSESFQHHAACKGHQSSFIAMLKGRDVCQTTYHDDATNNLLPQLCT
jgi:hypothetical protein